MENPAKQKSKKLLRTEPKRRERKNKCVGDVEHTEVFVSFIMCKKQKNEREPATSSMFSVYLIKTGYSMLQLNKLREV